MPATTFRMTVPMRASERWWAPLEGRESRPSGTLAAEGAPVEKRVRMFGPRQVFELLVGVGAIVLVATGAILLITTAFCSKAAPPRGEGVATPTEDSVPWDSVRYEALVAQLRALVESHADQTLVDAASERVIDHLLLQAADRLRRDGAPESAEAAVASDLVALLRGSTRISDGPIVDREALEHAASSLPYPFTDRRSP